VAERRGMGRGLAAILSVSEGGDREGAELRELAVELVSASPGQPRRRFDEESLQALAESVKERGVLQPVLVRPRPGGTYELVAGERRWRAAQIAGLQTLPALVQKRDDAQSLEVALIENMAREDLNPIEAARAVAGLVEELGLTREEVGRRVGRSRVAISNLLRLLDLPDEALALVEDGSLTEGHGRALLLADDHAARHRLARFVAERPGIGCRPAQEPVVGQRVKRKRDRGTLGAYEHADERVRQRQADDHALGTHDSPAVGELPEQREYAGVDARQSEDRRAHCRAVELVGESLMDRGGQTRPPARRGDEAIVEHGDRGAARRAPP
jgi:ParB family transcriptional regulator, chromosome partitioning protein